MMSTSGLNRTVVAPLSSAIIALMLAGVVVVGVDQVGQSVQPGEARLVPDGTVEVAVDGGEFEAVEGKAFRSVLGADDRVKVTEGHAVLELADGVRVELRSGSVVALGGTGADLRLQSGDLLVEARDARFIVDGGLAKMTVDGVAKLRRVVSLVAGVYEGSVLLASDSDARRVDRYRQAAAAGTGLLPREVDPLRLDPNDEWDQRILPKVLDLDSKLVDFGRSFETALPVGVAAGPELYRQVVPGLNDEPITPQLLTGRAPGENLIGLVLVSQDSGGFDDRVRNIFGFRAAGASWGLVAADRELREVPVLGSMQYALGALSVGRGVVAEPPREGGATPVGGGPRGAGAGGGRPSPSSAPTTPTTPANPPPGPGPTNPKPGGGTTDPGTGTGTPNPGGNPPPEQTPPDSKVIDVPPLGIPAVDNLLEPVVDPVENLLDGVLDGLLGLGSGTSTPSSSSSGKLLGGLLGG